MRNRLLTVFVICFSLVSFAQNISSIDFGIKNLGITVDGYFKTFTIEANFDSNNKLKSLFGKVKVESLRTGIENRDEHLLEEEYFNANKHEFITLKSTAINEKSENYYLVSVALTIKGKTKSMIIPVRLKEQSESVQINSDFKINRRDFNVGGSSFIMSNTVKISVVHYQDL